MMDKTDPPYILLPPNGLKSYMTQKAFQNSKLALKRRAQLMKFPV
jgi:hypothetical protein